MNLHFEQIIPSLPYLLSGVFVTLKYAGISVCLGIMWGTCLALARLSSRRVIKFLSSAYISLFRGTPLLVQLAIFYFATPQITGYTISAFEAGILTFSLNSGAYISEIIRAGIQSVHKGQMEAAYALGIPKALAMRDIIFPQALKKILPALVNEIVDLLKESSIVSVIGEADLLRRANLVAAETYLYFEPLLVVAAAYYVLVMIFSCLAQMLEKRMAYND